MKVSNALFKLAKDLQKKIEKPCVSSLEGHDLPTASMQQETKLSFIDFSSTSSSLSSSFASFFYYY